MRLTLSPHPPCRCVQVRNTSVREAVVPIPSRAPGVTAPALQALFPHVAEGGEGHLLVAVVDGSGAATLIRMFSYLQPPFEGPEALPQQQVGSTAGMAGAAPVDAEQADYDSE